MSEIPEIKSDLTADELAKLADKHLWDSDICKQIARHPNTSLETLKKLFIEYYQREVLSNPKINSLPNKDDILLELFYKTPDCFYDFGSYSFPSFYVEWAVNHPKTEVRKALASSHPFNLYILKKLAKDKDDEIRALIANNNYISDEIVNRLAEDKCLEVIKNLAQNPQTNHIVLWHLSNHSNKDVRVNAAKNRNIPLAIIEKLLQDRKDEVKVAIANNSKTPHFILESLLNNVQDIQSNERILAYIINNYNVTFTIKNRAYQIYKDNYAQFIESDILDFMVIKVRTDLEMKRLNWAKERGRNYLLKTYGKRSRLHLTDAEMIEFWQYLTSLPVTNNDNYIECMETELNDNIGSLEDIPF